jgi:ubiquinone/menaquinone biosynthesis C-methylase UbiE
VVIGATETSKDRMSRWDDPQTAELYDRFARGHGQYRDTSRDLVAMAHLEDAGRVVDLACGTGVTTEAILDRVGASTAVLALDASEAMLAVARRNVTDARVTWLHAPAVDLAKHADRIDAIVCNSAIWQLDMERAVAAAARVLRPGGRLVFNIGRQFLMLPFTAEELQPPKPTFAHLIQAVAILDYDFVPPHPAMTRGRPHTPDGVTKMLRRCGLDPVEARTFEYDDPPEAQLAWLQVPVFAQNVLPGMPYDAQLAVLTEAYNRLEKSQDSKSKWMAFLARKP